MDDPSRRDEPVLQRWGRRAVTIPLYFALFFLSLASLPIVLVATVAIDALRGSRCALSRCALFFIYPEGTRFTPERQRRALAHIRRRGDSDLVARAERLRYVLPPRLGGTMALLEAGTEADAVFCVHAGFEGVRTFHDLLSGALIDRTVEVEYWRVPATRIPKDGDARIDWLYDQWIRVDEWVGHRSEAVSTASAPPRSEPPLG